MKLFTPICVGLIAFGTQASAQALQLPTPATKTFEQLESVSSYVLPIGPFANDQVPFRTLSGSYSLETWRLGDNGQPSHLLMADLGRQLADSGYEIVYQCAEIQCGGFDFRFGINVVSEPHMHVDLGDYQFLAAYKPSEDASKSSTGDTSNYITLLVSRSPSAGFVQIARIGPEGASQSGEGAGKDLATVTSTMSDPNITGALSDTAIATQLDENGFAVLSDLVFETGSSQLGTGPFDSLDQLATYLLAHPEYRVTLVGHSDADGPLATNITLSTHRAGSVRSRLIDLHALPADQLSAEGIGFLAPLGSNSTDEGRTQNRRVEVVLTSTQ